jgi:hypothetical protein
MLELLLASPKKAIVGLPSNTGPCPTTLVGSNATAGFYGELTSASFISGSALAAACGLVAGTLMNDTASWLKFFLDDKVLFIPKLGIRTSFYWQDLYQAGVVYGDGTIGKNPAGANRLQNARVSVQGYTFIVRLMKCANSDPYVDYTTNDPVSSTTSEWNRLMYNICDTAASKSSQVGPNWTHYTEAQLGMNYYTWGQETPSNSGAQARIVRAASSLSYATYGWLTTPYNTCVWRPVLELVSPA